MKKSLYVAAVLMAALCFSAGAADSGEPLRADVFGNVYVGSSPFSVGKVESTGSGELRADAFGNVFVGSSPFSVGKVQSSGSGPLHADVFGRVFVGSSPFPVGIIRGSSIEGLDFIRP